MEREKKRKRDEPPKGQPPADKNRTLKRPRRIVPLSSDAVKGAVRERLKSIHSDLREQPAARRIKRAARSKDPALKGARNLDRVAWVIAHLRDDRDCVAVHVDADAGKLRVWANDADDGIKADVSLLIKAGAGNGTARDQLTAKLAGSHLDIRVGEPSDARRRRAQSRLTKAIEYVGELGTIRASAPTVEYDFEGDVHAEQVAADYLLGATPDRPPRLGVSKLCCFLCWRALVALRDSGQLTVLVTDTHLKVYENWPIPNFLRDEDVLLCFLEVDDEDDAADKLLARAINENTDDVLDAIRSFASVSGSADTGYYSSDDEDFEETTTTTTTTSTTTTTTTSRYQDDEEEDEDSEEPSEESMSMDEDHSSDEDYVDEESGS